MTYQIWGKNGNLGEISRLIPLIYKSLVLYGLGGVCTDFDTIL